MGNYADGTYGVSSATASVELESDKHQLYADQQSIVLEIARDAGAYGTTGTDIRRITGWGDSPKSRAMSNLLRDGELVRLKERRDRGHIYVLPENANGRELEPYSSIVDKHYSRGFSEGYLEGMKDVLQAVQAAGSLNAARETLIRLAKQARS